MTKQDIFSSREGGAEEEKFIAVELSGLEELKELKLLEYKNFKLNDRNALLNDIIAEDSARKALREIKMTEGRTSFFGIRRGGKIVAGGVLAVAAWYDGHAPEAHLYSTNVAPEWRGKGLAQILIDARVEKARQFGCQVITVDNEAKNPIGLVSKFNGGFILNGVAQDEQKNNLFELSRNIDDHSDADNDRKKIKTDSPKPQWHEIELDNIEAIKFWLSQKPKWVGVDIKNLGAADDNDPKNWVLIMENKEDVKQQKTGD
ncbi:MAG: hypothetical protein A3J93_04500 [Candidatus Magasanikbacteria bacterium RIFOXYC2_FULL_42_28]|uniref:N-acetyltransferase domain-containing protein n=1 Tax=Candidatus Magasanikbacteria bacterium RIFOXYC2_FULL_42_28 TaxID=1798704 RepID=A0A1F6NX47_9BACT|nr:MAG: hypothetical protein A3J93_04500 [Candidatus Magasanikbacteria bacterium RIFOXYC2_FULL_42_28]